MQQDPMEGRRKAARALARVESGLGDLWWAVLVRGILAGLVGLALLVWPSASLDVLVVLVGIFCLADGAVGLAGALRNGIGGANLLQPTLGIVIGLVLLLWPAASVRFLFIVLGVWVLVFGIGQLWAARQEAVASDERGTLTGIGGIVAALGLILILWPGSGVVTVAWVVALVALLLAALLIFLALRLRRLEQRVGSVAERQR
jgi:uncharacterized membrane protein HdeD (DUF308 family)